MSQIFDYGLFNFSGGSFMMPQFDSFFGSLYSNPFSNCNFNIFDYFNNGFNFTQQQFNFQPMMFQYPQYPSLFMPSVSSETPKMQSKTQSATPSASSVSIVPTGKTKKAEGLNSSIYIKEEITPGNYITKGKYLNVSNLKPYMKDALVKLDKKAKELGYTMAVIDGFRSHETQAAAKKKKPKLCAPAGKSAHEYGVAVDLALFKDGKQVTDIYKVVPEFGRYAQSLGLEWGAEWKSKYEPWHFNFNNWQYLADVSGEYKRWNHLA